MPTSEPPAAKLSLLDRFRRRRYYRREYAAARARGDYLYMPPVWRKGMR